MERRVDYGCRLCSFDLAYVLLLLWVTRLSRGASSQNSLIKFIFSQYGKAEDYTQQVKATFDKSEMIEGVIICKDLDHRDTTNKGAHEKPKISNQGVQDSHGDPHFDIYKLQAY